MKIIVKLLPALLIATTLAVPAHATPRSSQSVTMSGTLEGRNVIGMDGRRLGYILAVNDHARMVELQTPGGIAVSMPESRIHLFGGEVLVPNMTRGDVLAMERRQTGRTVAVNIDLRNRFRG